MGPGRDRTRDLWICSQTSICCQTRYRLRYAARLQDSTHIRFFILANEKSCDAFRNVHLSGYIRRMAENGFAPPPPREFCRHILSCRELKAESFKRCLHSVLRGVSL